MTGNPDKRFGRITDLRRGVIRHRPHNLFEYPKRGSCVTETVCCIPAMAKPEKFEHQATSKTDGDGDPCDWRTPASAAPAATRDRCAAGVGHGAVVTGAC